MAYARDVAAEEGLKLKIAVTGSGKSEGRSARRGE